LEFTSKIIYEFGIKVEIDNNSHMFIVTQMGGNVKKKRGFVGFFYQNNLLFPVF